MKKYLKFIIGAALIAGLWLSLAACSNNEPVKVEQPKVITLAPTPYVVTKTDPKIKIVKAKPHKIARHKPAEPKVPACERYDLICNLAQ